MVDMLMKDRSMSSDVSENMSMHSLEADRDVFSFIASEDEFMGVEHLLMEPECNKGFLGGDLGFDKFSAPNCFDIEDFSVGFPYDQIKIDADALDFNFTSGEEAKLEFDNETLQGMEVGFLHGKCGLQSTREGFLSGALPANKIFNLDSGQCEESCIQNQSSESVSQGFQKRDCDAEISDLSFPNVLKTEAQCDRLGHMKAQELEFSPTDSLTDVLHNENMSAGCESAKLSPSEVSEVGFCSPSRADPAGNVLTRKRVRRPTRRYIEEPFERKPQLHDKKFGASSKSPRDKFSHIRSHKQHCQEGFADVPFLSRTQSFKGACIQVPFDLSVEEGQSKSPVLGNESEDCKDIQVSVSDETSYIEPSSDDSHGDVSEDDFVASNTQKERKRKQHHRWWTLAEVMKLIEGVSQYGVGRWTVIKRILFSSSTHRSSVDLKDKWRNLLKASCGHSQGRRQVEQGRKQASHQVPESVLRRVRELALIYSCEKESKSKISCAVRTTTSGVRAPLSTAV